MKRVGLTCLCIFVALCGPLLVFRYFERPPRESELIGAFLAHHAEYEKLRDMLQADKTLVRVATWGAETKNSIVLHTPSTDDLAPERYRAYLDLLKKTGGKWASRGSNNEDVCVGVWGWGFAGNTRHMNICWLQVEPINQVASLDDHY